jgi:hypothetical protein
VLHNAVAPQEQQGLEPAYLKGGIHVNLPLGLGGATLQPTYYSPAGVAIEPLKTAASMIAPLEAEVGGAALGLDTFTGKTLTAPHAPKGEATEGQRPGVMLQDLLGGLVPGYRQATQLREMGGTPYSTSTLLNPTVKPGTKRDMAHTLFKLLSPERFTYDKGAGRAPSAPASPEQQRALRESERPNKLDEGEVQRILRESEHSGPHGSSLSLWAPTAGPGPLAREDQRGNEFGPQPGGARVPLRQTFLLPRRQNPAPEARTSREGQRPPQRWVGESRALEPMFVEPGKTSSGVLYDLLRHRRGQLA